MIAPKFQLTNRLRILLTVVVVLAIAGIGANSLSALSGNDFRAGRIIDNAVFENKNSMSVGQIQAFLSAKMPNCDTWGAQSYAGTSRRAYSEARGIAFPLVCLKDYYENTSNLDNNLSVTNGQAKGAPSGSISAAQIIYNAARDYNINPQVLLVLLQKEQGLVLDDWPWPIQYKHATGYGCPDSAPCDSQYYGFYNQVASAAWQFRQYLNNPNSYNHVVGNNYIAWNPNGGCGGGNVYISNQATAALYNYTPYQPNGAALSNLYGSGDGCSSYGNRNFWRYFTEWFGSTLAAPFEWSPQRMIIMDEGRNVEMTTDYLHKGERLSVVLSGTNTGTEIWYRDGVNPIVLGTYRPNDRRSEYCDIEWLSISRHCNRAARTDEAQVNPGGTFHFSFYIHAPNQGGEFREYFQPVLERRAWMTNDTGFHIYVNSTNYFNWQWLYFDAWTDSSKTARVDMNNLARGQRVYLELKVANRSATIWYNTGRNQADLGTQRPQDHNSFLYDPTWLSGSRAAAMTESSVKPGQTATFGFYAVAPGQTGEYREYVKPVLEHKGWMRDTINHIYMRVTR